MSSVAMDSTLRERLQRGALVAGYGAFFVAVLFVALIATFPTRQLQAYVEAQARKAGFPLTIGELHLRGVGGVTLDDVALKLPAQAGVDGKAGRPALDMHLDELRLDVAVWRALWRRELAMQVSLRAGDGGIEDGEVVVRPLATAAKAEGKAADSKAKDATAAADDPAAGSKPKGYAIDLELPSIDELPLGPTGLGAAALAMQGKVTGALEGDLSGSLRLHWGGSFDDANGKIALAITDAVLRKPGVDLPKIGKFELADLRMGTVTANVTIAPKAEIAVLAGVRGSDKATAIAFEKVEIAGRDIELVVEERAHALVPPGLAGVRMATLQLHFAFALPDAKDAKDAKDREDAGGDAAEAKTGNKGKGGKGGKGGEPGKDGADAAAAGEDDDDGSRKGAGRADDQRAKWSSLMEIAGSKLKPFIRNGYVGMTCTGLLVRPSCTPDAPRVAVGTRRAAEGGALPAVEGTTAGGGSDEAPAQDAGPRGVPTAALPTAGAPPTVPEPQRVEFKPAMPDTPVVPRPAPALAAQPIVEQPTPPAEGEEQETTPRGRGRGRPQPTDEPADEGEQAPRDEEAGEAERGGDERPPRRRGDEPEPEAEEGGGGGEEPAPQE